MFLSLYIYFQSLKVYKKIRLYRLVIRMIKNKKTPIKYPDPL